MNVSEIFTNSRTKVCSLNTEVTKKSLIALIEHINSKKGNDWSLPDNFLANEIDTKFNLLLSFVNRLASEVSKSNKKFIWLSFKYYIFFEN